MAEENQEIEGGEGQVEAPVSNIAFSQVSSTEDEVVEPIVAPEPIVETPEVPEVPETPETPSSISEIDEETAWKVLKEKKGLTQENFEELLTPKEQKKYAPEMEKFNEFIEKTGNKDYNKFLETQKDWSAESPENVLKNYIKLSNPDLTDREAEHLYNKKYNTADLDEELDEELLFGGGGVGGRTGDSTEL